MKEVSLKIYHYSKWALLVFLICIALLSLAGRALLSNAAYFKNAIEQELADYGIKGVALKNIEGHWQGLQPLLKIKGASLSIPGREQALSVNEMSVRVKLVPSLLSGDLLLESFHSSIEKLVLVRDVKGAWWLNDISLSAGNSADTDLDIYSFFQRLPSFVNIDIGVIQLRDLRHEADYLIRNSTLRSSRKIQQLSVELVSHLPPGLGRKIQFSLTGDAQNQQLFVKAERLDLARLVQLSMIGKTPLHEAVISLQSWIDLERFHLKQVVTEASVSYLSVNNEKNKLHSLNFSIQQKATAESNQWRINTKIKKIRKGKQRFADLNSQLLISKQGGNPRLWIDQVELSFLHSILHDVVSDESLIKLIAGLHPDAMVDNVVAELDIINPQDSIFGFNFTGLNTLNYRSIPALNGLSGSMFSSRGIGLLNIDSEQVSLDFADLFRQPIKLDTLKANAYVHIIGSTVYVDTDYFSAANADVSLQGRLWLEAAPETRPFLSLRANYKNGKVKAVPAYLPVKIMPEKVVEWLDKSLVSGDITQGDFLFHGRLQKPSLFAEIQSGVMHAAFNVNNPKIDYLANWPVAEQGDANIEFLNSAMNVDVSNVKYANTTVDSASIKIPDFLAANLFLNLKIETRADNLLATLSSLPVLNVFDEVKQKTKGISGPVTGEVKLDIPLSKKLGKKISVTAKADLKGVNLSIPEWMIDLKEMTGLVDIDNDRVTAEALSGTFYDDEIQLNIKPDTERKRTNFHLSGGIHSRNLLKLTPQYLQKPVSGISPWEVSVSVGHQSSKKSPILEIAANSSLTGTRLDFPEPAKVSKDEEQRIKFNASLFNKGIFPFDLSLADDLKASGRMNFAESSASNLQWLNVYLGGSNTILENSGVTVAGNTDLIDLDDWFDYQQQYFPEDDSSSMPFLQQVNSLELDIGRLVLAGQKTLNSKITIINDGKQLQGTIDSEQTKGSFELPYKMGALHPFTADLEFIKLKKSESKEKFKTDINDMPDLYIKSKAVSYEEMEFSDLTLSCKNEPDKFVIDQLDFSRDKVKLKSSGHWQFEPRSREHVSVFNINIKGADFGQTVNNLGLGETIKGGKVDFNGQIGWGGELYSINWPTLIGEVDLILEDGYLKNVDPGAGRFVGLLSFNALPRRLFLDFGDVVKEGMQFNEIRGDFNINGEILETDNASMDSIAAEVIIKGKTNLRHQTYDQTMTITPKVGDTLPLIATIAAGSTVGWGLLLLQKIFKEPIDKSVGIDYKITGSWEKPEVILIEKPKIQQEDDIFYDAN